MSEMVKNSGTKNPEIREYEIAHKKIAQAAAEEGFVLLKNEEGLLPLKKGASIALFGAGATQTVKGGTGSGNVFCRHIVTVYEGLKAAGFEISNEDWIESFEKIYEESRNEWKKKVWAKADGMTDCGMEGPMFYAYLSTPYEIPAGEVPTKGTGDTAIFVLSRKAGEGADRRLAGGDYYISDEELALLKGICSLYKNVILIINTGGAIDTGFVDDLPQIKSILYVTQPGQEGGHAIARVLLGEVTPSGKMSATWPIKYEDIPYAMDYSDLNGDLDADYYKQGVFVGYRYFDTFRVPVRYGFGFGLSYTDFKIRVDNIKTYVAANKAGAGSVTFGEAGVYDGDLAISDSANSFATSNGAAIFTGLAESAYAANKKISLTVNVKNTGSVFSGKEVVQVYASCPQGALPKEFRRLVAFEKTKLLDPGDEQDLIIEFSLDNLTSYDEKESAWILEEGTYGIYVGSSLESSVLVGSIVLDAKAISEQCAPCCVKQIDMVEMVPDAGIIGELRGAMEAAAAILPAIKIAAASIKTKINEYGRYDDVPDDDDMAIVKKLSTDQLIKLCTGELAGAEQSGEIGNAGISVPGSAAQTSACAIADGIPQAVLADGPAGIRLTQEFETINGKPIIRTLEESIEGGILRRGELKHGDETWYQFTTAFPVGTLIAQTWNKAVMTEFGNAIGEEMEEFNVTLWLAPGMNIHRNPLCGRNFEYYSEDPLLTGLCAGYTTLGVQRHMSRGTTIKHYACNSQENNRMGVDAVISERALREIYLKGFETCVKLAQPKSIMTSYNKINGIHSANNYDLCTKLARDEWDFAGVIMTDWTTTNQGPDCTAAGCILAGNDLVMPGKPMDHDNLRAALDDGSLDIALLRRTVWRLMKVF